MNRKRCVTCARIAALNSDYCGLHKNKDRNPFRHEITIFKKSYGWVYVIDTGLRENNQMIVKIGCSKNPTKRLKILQAANPFCKFILRVHVNNGAKRFEGYLQRFCESYFYQRELFKIDRSGIQKVVEEIRRHKLKVSFG